MGASFLGLSFGVLAKYFTINVVYCFFLLHLPVLFLLFCCRIRFGILKNNDMTNNVIRSVAIMLIGLVLIFMSESAMAMLIRIVGAAFFLPALVSIINLYVSRSESGIIPKVLISVIDVGSMAFGVWLMVAPAHFENVFVKLLALILLVFAVYQVIMIISAQRYSMVPMQMYIAPLLLVVAAIVLFSVSISSSSTISIIFGVSAVVSGVSDLLICLKLREGNARRLSSGKSGAVQKY